MNCLHEIFFDRALDTARALDAHYAATKTPVGPLHGLPVSLKDQVNLPGIHTSMGYIGWLSRPLPVQESLIAQHLRSAGAVFYVKSAVPQTLMIGETCNNIIGYVPNPAARHLGVGGSSGGEGALLALRASPLGFGTDVGGSIRIPAAFNGLCGLKPSSGRLPYEGMENSMDGQPLILSVVGPLAHSVATLRLAVRTCLAQQPWLHDPVIIELPWRDAMEQAVLDAAAATPGQLTFGIMRDDGLVRPLPPVRRALDIVVATIAKLGHQTVEWTPPSHKIALDIVVRLPLSCPCPANRAATHLQLRRRRRHPRLPRRGRRTAHPPDRRGLRPRPHRPLQRHRTRRPQRRQAPVPKSVQRLLGRHRVAHHLGAPRRRLHHARGSLPRRPPHDVPLLRYAASPLPAHALTAQATHSPSTCSISPRPCCP